MTGLNVQRLEADFGVEVSGLEPRIPLDDSSAMQLRKLFDEHGLLVFRGIDIDLPFQAYLSELLLGCEISSAEALGRYPQIYISNKEPTGAAPVGRLLYHSDSMWSEKDQVDLLSLYGQEVAQPATPTMFVSAVQGWDTLPVDLKERVEGRFALQSADVDTFRKRAAGDVDVLLSTYASGKACRETPIAFTHPRTGKTILYVSQQSTQHIVDMDEAEGDELLDALLDHLYAPDKQFAYYWRQGDLVIWDNLALQHARPNVTSEGPARTLRKTMLPLPRHVDEMPQFGLMRDVDEEAAH